MNLREVRTVSPGDSLWPSALTKRLGDAAPQTLWIMGNHELLALPKFALFCSNRCSRDAILRAHRLVRKWAYRNQCVISGFQSPLERECLRILIRHDAPVIRCPPRGMPQALPAQQAVAVAFGRMLFLTCFPPSVKRPTTATVVRRNELVAALADDVWFVDIESGDEPERPEPI